MSTSVNTIDPIEDPRWKQFIAEQPKASIFHHPSWLAALRKTYGLKPLAYTTAGPGEQLHDGLVFCPVRSWMTGSRLVSLPFSDHCDLLADTVENCQNLATYFSNSAGREFQYVEIRSVSNSKIYSAMQWQPDNNFVLHSISLDRTLESIFRGFHKNCVQQKIRRAERDGLRYESGRSEALLNHFYRLLVRTRRRHRVPPQPYRWYQNLISSMANRITLHIAFDQNQPAAAIVTLRHQKTLTCKYSCSDERLNSLGGIPFLFWQVIQEAKGSGMETVDLGRSDMNNPGLITFKERLGAMPSSLIYWTHSRHTQRKTRRNGLAHMAQRITPRSSQFIHYLPDSLLELSGRMLYKHLD